MMQWKIYIKNKVVEKHPEPFPKTRIWKKSSRCLDMSNKKQFAEEKLEEQVAEEEITKEQKLITYWDMCKKKQFAQEQVAEVQFSMNQISLEQVAGNKLLKNNKF